MGFNPRAAGTLSEARQQLASPPHIVILDLMLPDGNGTEILRQVRSSKQEITVAVVSGAGDQMLSEANRLGPDALFGKPVDLTDFQDWLGQQGTTRSQSATQTDRSAPKD
jgi:DNA-binding response OmpR family regulator